MNKRSSLIFDFCFSFILAFMECAGITSFLWATFNGFGGVSLEYTKIGEVAIFAMLMTLPALLLIVLSYRLFRLRKYKSDAKKYVFTILCYFMGTVIGIILFQFPFLFSDLKKAMVSSLIDIIRGFNLVDYPIG